MPSVYFQKSANVYISHLMYKGQSMITLCANQVGGKNNASSQSTIGVYSRTN